jgi:hypothetical protein
MAKAQLRAYMSLFDSTNAQQQQTNRDEKNPVSKENCDGA